MRVWFCTAVVCILQSVSPVAQNQTEPDQPRINTIEVLSRKVFDESSRGISAPYRVANKIHVRTRESVIRRELLFAPGDVLSPELLAQTERNLRALPFLREARVDTIPVDKDGDGHAEGVDVQVVTWDAWTLAPRIDFERVGDRSLWEFGFSEKNLLGFGKAVTVSHRGNIDRKTNRFSYRDQQFMGSRFVLTASLADLSDGDEKFAAFVRPFFSLEDKWAISVKAGAFSRRDPLYDGGDVAYALDPVANASRWVFNAGSDIKF